MKTACGVAIALLLACGPTRPPDPQVIDPCAGQCGSDEFCNSETGGVVDAGTFSNCSTWPPACDAHRDCECLVNTIGQCPATECGVGPTGTYVYHCMLD